MAPGGVEVCLLHEDPEMPEGPKVPVGVAVEQVVLAIHREMAETPILQGEYMIDGISGSLHTLP